MKALVSSKVYLLRNYKNGITIQDIMDNIVVLESKKITEEDLNEESSLMIDLFALITNTRIEKKIKNLKMVLYLYEYLYGVELPYNEYIDVTLVGKKTTLTLGEILEKRVNTNHFMLDDFGLIEGLTKHINQKTSAGKISIYRKTN